MLYDLDYALRFGHRIVKRLEPSRDFFQLKKNNNVKKNKIIHNAVMIYSFSFEIT